MVTIYAFVCVANGKAYIGCTRGQIAKRFREHRSLLKAEKHSEKDLLADWNTHGPDMFRMEVVYEMEGEPDLHSMRAMETFAMQRYKALGLLYNRNESSFAPTPEAIAKSRKFQRRGFTNTPESNMKRRFAQLGIPKNHGHKISATKQAKKVMR